MRAATFFASVVCRCIACVARNPRPSGVVHRGAQRGSGNPRWSGVGAGSACRFGATCVGRRRRPVGHCGCVVGGVHRGQSGGRAVSHRHRCEVVTRRSQRCPRRRANGSFRTADIHRSVHREHLQSQSCVVLPCVHPAIRRYRPRAGVVADVGVRRCLHRARPVYRQLVRRNRRTRWRVAQRPIIANEGEPLCRRQHLGGPRSAHLVAATSKQGELSTGGPPGLSAES